MNDIIFKDCDFRYLDDNDELSCKNKQGTEIGCDNCQENIHLNCDNFNAKKDFCLKFFRDNISELKECQEKTVFNDSLSILAGAVFFLIPCIHNTSVK